MVLVGGHAILLVAMLVLSTGLPTIAAVQEGQSEAISKQKSKRIEENVVTAEKREATVSDTSISVTAFSNDLIQDFGIQGPDDAVNFMPATTRDAYDIRSSNLPQN